MLGRGFLSGLPHPDCHLDAWQAIYDAQEPYPGDLNLQPYRKPRKREPRMPLTTFRLSRYGKHPRADGHGYVLEIFDERQHSVTDLPDGDDQAERFRAELFTQANRGRLLICANEADVELRAIWDVFGLYLVQQGYTLEPIANVHKLKGVRVLKSKQLWTIADASQVTGVPLSSLRRQNRRLGPRRGIPATAANRLWLTLDFLQGELWRTFGVGFKVTIGTAAVKAASYHMPEGQWLWRPNPLLVAMLRHGGGFRGGHVRSQTYSGPAWQIDVRRMYTACLAKELPMRVSWGVWQGPDDPEPGFFMCTVRGRGRRPVYISRWDQENRTFELGLWNGGECIALLTTDEAAALGRLGYLVLPGYGFHFFRTFTLKGFVHQIQTLTSRHGSKSAVGRMCKSLGNNVFGKWGQSPRRWDVAFSLAPPDESWLPYTDDQGEPVPLLWTVQTTRYRYTQHVELAAVVTSHARAVLYTKIADLLDAGYDTIKENTDAIWIRGPAPPDAGTDSDVIGSWQFVGYEPRATLLRTGAYAFGSTAKRPGAASVDVAKILHLWRIEAAGTAGDLEPGEALELAG